MNSRTGYVPATGGGSAAPKIWAHYGMSADQSSDLTAGNIVAFDHAVASDGSGAITDDGFGLITLPQGKTYRVRLDIGASWSGVGGELGVDVYGYSVASATLVNRAYINPPTFAANITRGPGSSEAIFTVPTGADETIAARITVSTLTTKIYAEASGTRLIIQEI